MKKKYFTISLIFIVTITLVSCTKYTPLNSTSNIYNTTTTTDTAPLIKFYDVMNFGSMDVNLNAKKVTSVAKFYASSYISAKEGTNSVSINFPNKSSVLNASLDLVRNTKYSCFFYMVGNEWKYNLVKDDLSIAPITNYSAVRILDFRTEAYYNYINVRVASPGGDIVDQKNRNFLDHVTYSGYTNFKTIISGTYSIKMYNDTLTTSQRLGVNFDSKGIYSILLTTPGNITPYSNAIFYIYPDVVKHN